MKKALPLLILLLLLLLASCRSSSKKESGSAISSLLPVEAEEPLDETISQGEEEAEVVPSGVREESFSSSLPEPLGEIPLSPEIEEPSIESAEIEETLLSTASRDEKETPSPIDQVVQEDVIEAPLAEECSLPLDVDEELEAPNPIFESLETTEENEIPFTYDDYENAVEQMEGGDDDSNQNPPLIITGMNDGEAEVIEVLNGNTPLSPERTRLLFSILGMFIVIVVLFAACFGIRIVNHEPLPLWFAILLPILLTALSIVMSVLVSEWTWWYMFYLLVLFNYFSLRRKEKI